MLSLMLQRESSSVVQDKMIYPFSCFVSAFLANTTSTSAKVLLPIQRFWPSICHPPGTCSTAHQNFRCMLFLLIEKIQIIQKYLKKNPEYSFSDLQYYCNKGEWKKSQIWNGNRYSVTKYCNLHPKTDKVYHLHSLQYVSTRSVGFSFIALIW